MSLPTPSPFHTFHTPHLQLWDPSYRSESWIADGGQNVYLIPRMKAWVNANYPGTPIGITEYNWGADGDMNGATAQVRI